MDVDCRRQTSGGRRGRLNADRCGQGGEGKKLAKTCEHLLCMTPKENLYCVVNFLRDSGHLISHFLDE